MINAVKNFITSFLMVAMMAPFLYFGVAPQKTEAFDMGTYAGQLVGAVSACLIAGAIEEIFSFIGTAGSMFSNEDSVPVKETNAELLNDTETTAESTAEIVFKECVLDPIIWVAKNMFIDFLTQVLLDWIREGFDGAEVYLRDSNVYFRALANLAFSTFVTELDLQDWLCAPFAITVSDTMRVLSSSRHYGDFGDAKCSLEDVFGNLSNASAGYSSMVDNGDIMFTGGGISVAMTLMTDSNNAYGSLFTAQAEAASRMGNVVGSEAKQLDYGNGYFPKRCEDDALSRSICAPGQLVAQQIDDWLGGGLGQLEVADEVSEILSAIIGGLVNHIFMGDDGDPSLGLREDRDTDDNVKVKNLDESGSELLTPTPEIAEPEPVPPPTYPVMTGPPNGEWVFVPNATTTTSNP